MASGQAQTLESLRTGDFVQQLAVYVDQIMLIVYRRNAMCIPELLKKGAGRAHGWHTFKA
jgi:hypothetical protein